MFFPPGCLTFTLTQPLQCSQLLKPCDWPPGLPTLVDFFLSSNLRVNIPWFWECSPVGGGKEKSGKEPSVLASSVEDWVCCCTLYKQLLFLALSCVSTLLLSLSLFTQGVRLCDKESLMRFMWPGEDMCCENCLPSTECQEGPLGGCQEMFIQTEWEGERERGRKISI